jgi:hypothetical protein
MRRDSSPSDSHIYDIGHGKTALPDVLSGREAPAGGNAVASAGGMWYNVREKD